MPAFPTDETILSHILVVDDLAESTAWYRDVLGASLFREYGGSTSVFDFNGAWIILVTEGGPTPDKPAVVMQKPTTPDAVSHSMTFRVADCRAAYRDLRARGATFLTEPVESDWEIRAFFRDPSGHLFEISEAKS